MTDRVAPRPQLLYPLLHELGVSPHRNPLVCDVLHVCLCSVVLDDLAAGPVKKVLVGMKLAREQAPAQRLLDLSFTGISLLPTRAPNLADDVINVGDHTLDNDWRVHQCGLTRIGR